MRFLPIFLALFGAAFAKLPELSKKDVTDEFSQIMQMHASTKTFSPELVKKMLVSFVDELDPAKTYFVKADVKKWIDPTPEYLEKVEKEVSSGNFNEFEKIHDEMIRAIERRRLFDREIQQMELPKGVKAKEFKDMDWAESEEALLTRLQRVRSLQIASASKLNEEVKEKSIQRIQKRQDKFEEEIINLDPLHKERYLYSIVMKAFANSLDSHTSYFTPDEAQQFMISVQQRLYGIGAQLRDDLSGFTITKIIEGGPAANSKEIKLKDKIIAVNGEPVVGMDIVEAVELIRGEEFTPVTLTLIRESSKLNEKGEEIGSQEEKLDVTLVRSEVKLKESRYESSKEPYGDGAIGYLRLYSFYQDQESSSSEDLANEIRKLKKNENLKGIILDLRYNSGGLLNQAVQVAGLFITKGIVVSIKDDTGDVQHLRELDGKMEWDGPLIVLINRASASASEIVAQALQDYGRAIVVGDDHTYGKGSFQTFTLNPAKSDQVNPKGEYKVTRGRYYTVSGKTPQLNGVESDIIVPGTLSELDIGEKFTKFPLEGDKIKENYADDLHDIPFYQRDRIKSLYRFDLQPKLTTYVPYLPVLKKNSDYRVKNDKNYQAFLKELKKDELEEDLEEDDFGKNDLQLLETYNVMKDLILLQKK
ncbi:MAG: PDZ domain-containing protein [Chlamydiia bacterium]|nr:PDZ domain-containing protein [Chlamydiia bacterium]